MIDEAQAEFIRAKFEEARIEGARYATRTLMERIFDYVKLQIELGNATEARAVIELAKWLKDNA